MVDFSSTFITGIPAHTVKIHQFLISLLFCCYKALLAIDVEPAPSLSASNSAKKSGRCQSCWHVKLTWNVSTDAQSVKISCAQATQIRRLHIVALTACLHRAAGCRIHRQERLRRWWRIVWIRHLTSDHNYLYSRWALRRHCGMKWQNSFLYYLLAIYRNLIFHPTWKDTCKTSQSAAISCAENTQIRWLHILALTARLLHLQMQSDCYK